MDIHRGAPSGIVAGIILLALGFVFSFIYPASTEWYMNTFDGMNMIMMWLATFLIGLFMGLTYSVVESSIPGEGARRGVFFGIIVWLFAGTMWPIMAIGFAPFTVTIFDVVSGFIMYIIAGAILVLVYDRLGSISFSRPAPIAEEPLNESVEAIE